MSVLYVAMRSNYILISVLIHNKADYFISYYINFVILFKW